MIRSFSVVTHQRLYNMIKTCLRVLVFKQHEKYFGFPSLVGRSKIVMFGDFKTKV
jgi:hypothetical protein